VDKSRRITSLQDAVSASDSLVGEIAAIPWWRGQSDRAWPLKPCIFRIDRGPRSEQNIITTFKLRAPSRYPGCPSHDDAGGWLSLMQHYRVPTRLLDWTESILVALYFAVNESQNVDGQLWALNPNKLNSLYIGEARTLTLKHCSVAHVLNAAFDGAILPVEAFAVVPTEVDIRMLLQQSMFTIHSEGTALEMLSGSESCLYRWVIPAEAKQELRSQLGRMGISGTTLFPDLEHLATDLAVSRWAPWSSQQSDSPKV
jgi:hypothetical protein